MQTVHKVGVGLLLGLAFVGGIGLRSHSDGLRHQPKVSSLGFGGDPDTRVAALSGTDVNFQPLQTLYTVLARVRQSYVEQLDDKMEGKMTYDAMRAMLASLKDLNTRFVEPDEVKTISDAQSGKFHGIGAMLGIKRVTNDGITEEQLVVISPIVTGPAATAKLQPGDVIMAVDGKNVLPLDPFQRASKIIKDSRTSSTPRSELKKTLEAEQSRIDNGIGIVEAQKMLSITDGKRVELTVQRAGASAPLKIAIDERQFQVQPVISRAPDANGLGYIRINCFCSGTAGAFRDAIASLNKAGAKGLVLDIRDLSGGEPSAALDVAKYLAPNRNFGYVLKSNNRRDLLTIPNVGSKDRWNGQIAVLINNGTARTAELLGSALKNAASAKLIGSTTYGDSAYTSLFGLEDGSAVVMTTGKLVTSKNEDFTGKGIAADVAMAAGASDDAQMREAAKALASAGGKS